MAKIKLLKAREILDSRGNPTIETQIILDNELVVKASVPAGASLGNYEAVELRDNDPKRYGGMGVLGAVANVNQVLAKKVIGLDPIQQMRIDEILVTLDGTENKSKLGANAILSVSQAVCKAGAAAKKIPIYLHVRDTFFPGKKNLKIPTATFNLINGGKHGAGNLNFQEFHVIPKSEMEFPVSLRVAEEIYQTLKKVLMRHGADQSVGDEGGFAPHLFTNVDALEVLKEAIGESGYNLEEDVFLGLDVAASQFYEGGKYKIRDKTMPMDTGELVEYYRDINSQYHLMLLEDPFHEDDWKGWKGITKDLPKTIVVGDDLLATNKTRILKAIKEKACSGVLVKPNQIGTISEAAEVIRVSHENRFQTVVSHRSGETNDDFIADFAVGTGAGFVKFGAPARGERVSKYNRLLKIESELELAEKGVPAT
ncbi:phosphopyruvate hydratase [Patescibacteria group bacterium]